jgi:hypothetical protein
MNLLVLSTISYHSKYCAQQYTEMPCDMCIFTLQNRHVAATYGKQTSFIHLKYVITIYIYIYMYKITRETW